MEITVITEEENPMLHRTDVRFRVSHAEATPDRLAVRDSLAARLNKSADEVVIRSLDTKFGMRETLGEAKVYQGAEFATDVEQEHMLVRNKIGEHEEAAEPEADDDAESESSGAAEEAAEDAAEEPEGAEEAAESVDDEAEESADDGAESEADETAAEAADESDEPDADEAEASADDDADEEETEE